MNIAEKRDFINRHLYQMDEKTIDELYEMLNKNEVLKEKLTQRALNSEKDIKSGKFFNRGDLEKKIG